MQKIEQLDREVLHYQNGWAVAGKKGLDQKRALDKQKRALDKLYADNAQLHAAAHRAGLDLQGEASHSGLYFERSDPQMRGQF